MFNWIKKLFKKVKQKDVLHYEFYKVQRANSRAKYVVNVFINGTEVRSESFKRKPSTQVIQSIVDDVKAQYDVME